MSIGCKTYSIGEWFLLTDEEIEAMHYQALSFRKKWKPILELILSNQ
jgi:hypothetical protein